MESEPVSSKISIKISKHSQNSLSDICQRELHGNLGNKNLECQETENIKLLSTCYWNSVSENISHRRWQTFKMSCLKVYCLLILLNISSFNLNYKILLFLCLLFIPQTLIPVPWCSCSGHIVNISVNNQIHTPDFLQRKLSYGC